MGYFNGMDAHLKQGSAFYTVRRAFPKTNSHHNQNLKIVGTPENETLDPAQTMYQTQFWREFRPREVEAVTLDSSKVISRVGLKKVKPKGKTVHARDWRRLDVKSPTYARTDFKIMDNTLVPEVPFVSKKVEHPTYEYPTLDWRQMQAARLKLKTVGDARKRSVLGQRLDIWGT